MSVCWIERDALESPPFFLTNLVGERQNLALRRLIEQHRLLRRRMIVLVRYVLIRWLVSEPLLRIPPRMIWSPTPIRVLGEVVDGHDGRVPKCAGNHGLASVATTGSVTGIPRKASTNL